MKPSSGESAPLASMSRSESSRDVSAICSSLSTPSGRGPLRSISLPPCGSISCVVSTTVIAQAPHVRRVDRSLQTDARAKPVHPDGDTASGVSRCDLCGDEPKLLELRDHQGGALLGVAELRVEHELGARRLFVGVADAGELRDLSFERLLVEALHVTLGALVDRGLHVDLDEGADLIDALARLLPRLLVRGDRGGDHGSALARQA